MGSPGLLLLLLLLLLLVWGVTSGEGVWPSNHVFDVGAGQDASG